MILILGTAVVTFGCWIFFEIMKRHWITRAMYGIKELPIVAKFGVFIAYRYYYQLLKKLKKTPATEIIKRRIRVPNLKKLELLTRSYVKYQLNLL